MIEVLLQHRLWKVYYVPSFHVPNESLIQFEINQPLHLISNPQINQPQCYPRRQRIPFPLNCFIRQGFPADLCEEHLGHESVAGALVKETRADHGS